MQQSQHDQLRAAVIAKKMGGQLLADDERRHVAECLECMKAIVESLEHKHKSEGPAPDSDRSRPGAQRALERACQVFQREFGISLSGEPPAAKAS